MGLMKALRILMLIALGVSCHLDKLLNGGGSGASPPSNGTPVGLAFSRLRSSPRAGRPIGPVQVSVVDSAGQPVAGVDSTTVAIALGSNPGGATLRGTPTTHPTRGVATFTLVMGDEMPRETRLQFLRDVVARVSPMPAVTVAGITNRLPVRDGGYQGPVGVEGRPDLEGTKRPNSLYRTATPGFFRAMGMKLREGRGVDGVDCRPPQRTTRASVGRGLGGARLE